MSDFSMANLDHMSSSNTIHHEFHCILFLVGFFHGIFGSLELSSPSYEAIHREFLCILLLVHKHCPMWDFSMANLNHLRSPRLRKQFILSFIVSIFFVSVSSLSHVGFFQGEFGSLELIKQFTMSCIVSFFWSHFSMANLDDLS